MGSPGVGVDSTADRTRRRAVCCHLPHGHDRFAVGVRVPGRGPRPQPGPAEQRAVPTFTEQETIYISTPARAPRHPEPTPSQAHPRRATSGHHAITGPPRRPDILARAITGLPRRSASRTHAITGHGPAYSAGPPRRAHYRHPGHHRPPRRAHDWHPHRHRLTQAVPHPGPTPSPATSRHPAPTPSRACRGEPTTGAHAFMGLPERPGIPARAFAGRSDAEWPGYRDAGSESLDTPADVPKGRGDVTPR
ncbi:hypothetical protein BJ971_007050 [Actinoplanes digitatis]|uniref:Uncharacterized protein n=1 Tax=Actinoplanes digitatis TaxID=1868 RepID=A0A7W7I4X4_9ACTN|nr:hypothetical protein [Actinoplanes digitatis]